MMRRFAIWFWAALLLVLMAGVASAQSPVIDHTSIAGFDTLTNEQIAEAGATSFLFIDRSVGWNVDTGLTTLAAQDPRFARGLWGFLGWPRVMPAPNPDCSLTTPGWNGMWTGYGYCFVQHVERHPGPEVASYWYDYLTGLTTPNVLANFFGPAAKNQFRAGDWLAWRTSHPGTTLFFWTTSLPSSDDGTGMLQRLKAFNVQARAWAAANHVPLLDAADILAHRADGSDCAAADGSPVICSAWTSDVPPGGHLNAAGQARMARAVWLMLVAVQQ